MEQKKGSDENENTAACQLWLADKSTASNQSEFGIDEDWIKNILTNSKRMTEDEAYRLEVAKKIF